MKSVYGIIIIINISEVTTFNFSLMQKKQKIFTGCYCFFGIHESSISSLKIENLKTTSKLCSAARAVRLSGSTCGLLPLRFLVVFRRF